MIFQIYLRMLKSHLWVFNVATKKLKFVAHIIFQTVPFQDKETGYLIRNIKERWRSIGNHSDHPGPRQQWRTQACFLRWPAPNAYSPFCRPFQHLPGSPETTTQRAPSRIWQRRANVSLCDWPLSSLVEWNHVSCDKHLQYWTEFMFLVGSWPDPVQQHTGRERTLE